MLFQYVSSNAEYYEIDIFGICFQFKLVNIINYYFIPFSHQIILKLQHKLIEYLQYIQRTKLYTS